MGVDISDKALQTARQNAEHIRTLKKEIDVTFTQSNLFENFADSEEYVKAFEMIVANPPYIQSHVIDTLMPEVGQYEPRLALDGKEDGLYFYRLIIEQAQKYLAGGGELYFEIGCDQGYDVKKMMEEAGYKEVEVIKDFAGLDRVVCGILP